jgi:acyl-CoA thioesterase FadM
LLVPLAGYLVLFYQEIFLERLFTLRYNFKSLTNKSLVTDLKIRRQEIQKVLNEIKTI